MKKITACFLLIVLAATFMVVPAFSEELPSDFEFMVNLSLVDSENVFSSDYLTRIDLAEIIFKIVIGNKQTFSEDGSTCSFEDVPAEKSHIVSVVSGLGVMRGYSDTVFAPDDVVTYNQVIKVLVSFLGYDVHANRLGGYPAGYLMQASVIGLLNGENIAGDSKATFGGIATLLKRAVNVDFAMLDGDIIVPLKGVSYLEYYMNIKHRKAVVTGNYLTNFSDDRTVGYFGIYLDDEFYYVKKSASGIQNLLGFTVDVFYEEVDGSKYICFYEEGRNKVLEFDGKDIYSASSGEYKYYDKDDNLLSVAVSPYASLIYNGSHMSSFSVSDLNPFKNNGVDGKIRLTDNNSDGQYDIVVVYVYETHIVREVKNNKIYSFYSPSTVIDIRNYKERNIDIANIEGDPISPSSLKEGQVINVARDKNSNIKQIIVSRDYVSGSVDEVVKNGNKITGLTINGVTFDVSPVLFTYDANKRLAPGIEVTAYFNCLAKITHIDVDSKFKAAFESAYLVDAGQEGGPFAKEVSVMLFKPDATWDTLKLENRVKINGEMCDATEFFVKAGLTENGEIQRQIIMYKVFGEGGNISEIEFADKTGNYETGFYEFPAKNSYYYEKIRTFNGYFAVEGGRTKVYQVPSEDYRDDYDDYRLINWPAEGSTMLNCKAYGTEKEGLTAEAVICFVDKGETTMDSKAPIFVVEKVAETADIDGNIKIKITGDYVDGTTYGNGSFFADEYTIRAAFGGNLPAPGDVFKVNSFEKSGKGTQFTPLFDYSSKTYSFMNPVDPSLGASHRYAYGTAIDKVGTSMRLAIAKSDIKEVHSLVGDSYRIIEVKTDRRGEVTSVGLAKADCVIDENTHPGEGSKILIYSRGAVGVAIIVYN